MSELDQKAPTSENTKEHSANNSSQRKLSSARQVISLIFVLLLTPAVVWLGALYQSRNYILVSMVIIVVSMIPFFISFERRKPQAREIVTLACMIALAIASRALFAAFPQFKPMVAIIMLIGIAFGSSSGFLAGSIAAFVSNFIFGQGPWTPWQMLSYGLCGYAFGFLAERGIIARDNWSIKARIAISIAGALFVIVIAGPILDTSSLIWMMNSITWESALAVYVAGLPLNVIHGVATFVTLFVVGNAILDQLARLRVKYGILDVQD